MLQGANSVAVFDTAAPGTTLGTVQVSGLAPGELLAGIDYRYMPIAAPEQVAPPPQLFGLGVVDGGATDTVRLYSIDLIAGVATPVGTGIAVTVGGTNYGIDFNPAVDRVRVVNDMDENLRINPNNGALAGDDVNLTPAGSQVSGVAYDRVHVPAPPAGPVTAYAISVPSASLVTIGGFNGMPVGANGGQLMNSKPLGVAMSAGNPASLDITPGGGAYAVLTDAATGQPGLFSIDLNSGAATALGQLPGTLSGFALVPQSALPQFAVPDKAPPTIALAGVRAKMSFASFLKGVSAKVTPSEPASLSGELLGIAKKAKGRPLASFTRVLARASLPLAAGERTLKLKPKRKKVGRPAKAFRVQVRITAADAAGNAATTTRTIKVRPPQRKRRAG